MLRPALDFGIAFLSDESIRHEVQRPPGQRNAAMRFANRNARASHVMRTGEIQVQDIAAGLTIQVQGRVKALYVRNTTRCSSRERRSSRPVRRS